MKTRIEVFSISSGSNLCAAKSKPVSVSQGSTKKKDSFHHEQEIVEVEEEEQEHPENVVQEENEDEDENENEEEEEEEEEKDIEEKASLPKHELTATQLKKRQKRNASKLYSNSVLTFAKRKFNQRYLSAIYHLTQRKMTLLSDLNNTEKLDTALCPWMKRKIVAVGVLFYALILRMLF